MSELESRTESIATREAAVRGEAWLRWSQKRIVLGTPFVQIFGAGFDAGVAAERDAHAEVVRALVEAADDLMNQYDAYQTRPSRDSAFGISFERWAALRTTLRALTASAPSAEAVNG